MGIQKNFGSRLVSALRCCIFQCFCLVTYCNFDFRGLTVVFVSALLIQDDLNFAVAPSPLNILPPSRHTVHVQQPNNEKFIDGDGHVKRTKFQITQDTQNPSTKLKTKERGPNPSATT